MKLKKFKVTHFRSVMDSGWVSCDDVTTLIGINESGKSNILLALWKLKPTRGGEIDYLHDLPVTELSKYDKCLEQVSFIEAVFLLDSSAINLRDKVNIDFSEENEFYIKRYYNGKYSWEFINKEIQKRIEELEKNHIDTEEQSSSPDLEPKEIFQVIFDEIPSFVYYSNYGNLASKIYLPHAIKWIRGEQIEGIDTNENQLLTIKVLFDYVGLEPEEILEYGRNATDIARNCRRRNDVPTTEDIDSARDAKEKRALLLQSAGTKLTKDFREWWKQGEYQFRFQADGDYFQIWVSDAKRPEEVDLELRSTGLQWFLSFYLVFIVESQNDNKNAILLLDEAGLTLHPLAQKDLAKFFNKLSESNQIVNTTHSPFIIDTENIDRCRVVYYDDSGYTIVSEDLREGSGDIGQKSVYAIHAALGLTVSDVMLQGSQIVIVEGVSDQYYLTTIKNILIREGKLKPNQEILFAPSGGIKGIQGITGLVAAKNDDLPYIILDSDSSGTNFGEKLIQGLYKDCKTKVLTVKDFTEMENSEIEDLIPYEFLKKSIERLLSVQDEDDEFEYNEDESLIPQIENYANKHHVKLTTGWKVDLAKAFKKQASLKKNKKISKKYLNQWIKLFQNFV